MKGTILRISAVIFAISACFAIANAQDKDDIHNHHIVAKKVTLTTQAAKKRHSWAYAVEHRGHKKTTVRRTVVKRTWTSRPYYHPRKIYTDKAWEAKIRAARHRKHHHHVVVWTTKHDNGKHKGWYIGKGNPHRDNRWPDKRHKGKDHDDKGDRDKGHGHGHGKGH